jgi:hypothetical protein
MGSPRWSAPHRVSTTTRVLTDTDRRPAGLRARSADLLAVLDDRGSSGPSGASMGAHTLGVRARAPERRALVITPAFDPADRRPDRWTAGTSRGGLRGRWRRGLRRGLRPGRPRAVAETIDRVLHQRLASTSIRRRWSTRSAVPRSRPFEEWEELSAIEAPTVIASRDEVDPEHPLHRRALRRGISALAGLRGTRASRWRGRGRRSPRSFRGGAWERAMSSAHSTTARGRGDVAKTTDAVAARDEAGAVAGPERDLGPRAPARRPSTSTKPSARAAPVTRRRGPYRARRAASRWPECRGLAGEQRCRALGQLQRPRAAAFHHALGRQGRRAAGSGEAQAGPAGSISGPAAEHNPHQVAPAARHPSQALESMPGPHWWRRSASPDRGDYASDSRRRAGEQPQVEPIGAGRAGAHRQERESPPTCR